MLVLQGHAGSCSSSYGWGTMAQFFLLPNLKNLKFQLLRLPLQDAAPALRRVEGGAGLLLVLTLGHCPMPQPSSASLPLHHPGEGHRVCLR